MNKIKSLFILLVFMLHSLWSSAQINDRVIKDGIYYDSLNDGNVSVAKFYNAKVIIVDDSIEGLGDITQIGSQSAIFCGNLEKVVLPQSITYIGDGAFSYCPGLRAFYINVETPPRLGVGVFNNSNIESCTLIVPEGMCKKYQSDR